MIKSQNHQVIRPIGKPLTEEEKKRMVIKELMDKREAFALTIMGGLCSNPEIFKQEVDAKTLAGMAVKTADALLEKLYPLEEEKPQEETPAEKERNKLKGNLKEEVCASDVCAYLGKNVCTLKRDEYCPMFKPKEEKEK